MERIFLYGAGAHAKVVLDALEKTRLFQVEGLIDDRVSRGARALGYEVIGGAEALLRLHAAGVTGAIVAIGDNPTRRELAEALLAREFRLVSAAHPLASVGRNVVLGEGAVVLGGAVIDPEVRIGRGTIVNTRALIAHDTQIGEFAHVACGAIVGAYCHVDAEALIGMGAIVLPHVRVGRGATIGAGSVVTRDVGPGVVVTGNPARSSRVAEHGVGDEAT